MFTNSPKKKGAFLSKKLGEQENHSSFFKTKK